jgi:hypothetical protein
MEIIKDSRGNHAHFNDLYGRPCYIREGFTISDIPYLVIGRPGDPLTLSRGIAFDIIPIFQKFVETGKIL